MNKKKEESFLIPDLWQEMIGHHVALMVVKLVYDLTVIMLIEATVQKKCFFELPSG